MSAANSETSPAKRQGTMEATAKEGVEYLKEAGKETLLKAQGLVEENGTATNGDAAHQGSPEKQSTMKATAEEGAAVLESLGGAPDADAKTRAQAAAIDEAKADGAAAASPRKTKTMADTTEEAKKIVGDEELGETRSETKAAAAAEAAGAAGEGGGDSTSPTRPKRTSTIEATVKEGEALLDKTGGSDEPPAAKKTKTMDETVKEGEAFVNGGEKGAE